MMISERMIGRLRSRANIKKGENPTFVQIWLLIYLTSSRIRRPFCTFSSIFSLPPPYVMKLKLLEPTVDIFQKIELSRQ
jgi:hypothetical protein